MSAKDRNNNGETTFSKSDSDSCSSESSSSEASFSYNTAVALFNHTTNISRAGDPVLANALERNIALKDGLLNTPSLKNSLSFIQEKNFASGIRYGGFSMRPVISGNDRMKIFKLRSEVYQNEKGWVKSHLCYERDQYDDFATHFIISNRHNDTIATVRSISSEFEWMGQAEYNHLFHHASCLAKKQHTNEISRLAIEQNSRNLRLNDSVSLLDFIFSGLLYHNAQESMTDSFFIGHAALGYKIQKSHLVIQNCSNIIKMPDGCSIRAFNVNTHASIRSYRPFHKIVANNTRSLSYLTTY